MQQYKSSLEFLMDRLDIPGKELAEALGLDESLVSKWKHNTRPLHLRSPHLSSLVSYLLNDKPDNYIRYAFIKKFLAEYNGTEPDADYPSVFEDLSVFLTSNHSVSQPEIQRKIHSDHLKKSGIQTHTYVFKGNQGRQMAIDEFFMTLFNEPMPQEVCIVSQEDLTWMIGEERFLKKWIHYLSTAIEKGHQLTVIYWIDRPINELGLIFNLYLPLYLKGNITTYYIPKYTDLYFKCSLFLIKNKAGLWGMEGKEPAERFTTMFYDSTTLSHYLSVFNTFAGTSKKLMKSYSKADYYLILEEMQQRSLQSRNSIFVSPAPSFLTLPQDLFDELLGIAGLSKEKTAVAKSIYQKSRILSPDRDHLTTTFIFNKEAVSTALTKSTYNYIDLSLLVDQEVEVPAAFFKRHLYSLIEQCETTDGLKVGLTEVPIAVNLFIQDENFFFCWNFEESEKILLFYEHNLNRSIYYHYDQLWKAIPTFNKDPEFFRQKLDQKK